APPPGDRPLKVGRNEAASQVRRRPHSPFRSCLLVIEEELLIARDLLVTLQLELVRGRERLVGAVEVAVRVLAPELGLIGAPGDGDHRHAEEDGYREIESAAYPAVALL